MTTAYDPLLLRLNPQSLDDVALGLVRISLEGHITYLNKAARDIAGPGINVGASLSDLHLTSEAAANLHARLEDRRHQSTAGMTYPLKIDRQDLGTTIFVDVVAIPEYGGDGKITGSVGIVTDKSMQRANVSLHHAITGKDRWQDLLTAFDSKLRRVVRFDSIIISLLSADQTAVRIFYQRPEWRPADQPSWRWWPMPAFVKADLNGIGRTRTDDVKAMFANEPYRTMALEDPPTRDWLKVGYRHMLRRTVLRQKHVLALVTLLRLDDQAFTDADVQRIEQLPVGEAVLMALALDRQKELEWGLELIGRLGLMAGDLSKVAQVLVEELRTNFAWKHVSLFRVDNDSKTLTLVHQSAVPGARLSDHHTQSIDFGLLGYVARSGQPVRIADVRQSATYRIGITNTLSEMCLPVPGDPVRWILNVESSDASAFAPDEEATVSRLLKVAGLILDRTLAIQFNATVLDSVADAIIQTSAMGVIRNVNPACVRLLDRPLETLVGTHLSGLISAPGDHVDPPGFAAELVAQDLVTSLEVELRPREGLPIKVLLSGRALPPQIGGKVYVASDLRPAIAIQRMETFQQAFQQIASESRLPLALVAAHLDELRNVLTGNGMGTGPVEILDKARRQLRRVDLPLERVVRMAATNEGQELPLQAFSLAEFARKLIADLPKSQASDVHLSTAAPAASALAARAELYFCAASVLAFLLRMKAQRDAVRVSTDSEASTQFLSFELFDRLTEGPSATRLSAKSAQQREFALAETVIVSLMQRMGGAYELEEREGICLRLKLASTGLQ
jgi:PAS domain-containing protein